MDALKKGSGRAVRINLGHVAVAGGEPPGKTIRVRGSRLSQLGTPPNGADAPPDGADTPSDGAGAPSDGTGAPPKLYMVIAADVTAELEAQRQTNALESRFGAPGDESQIDVG